MPPKKSTAAAKEEEEPVQQEEEVDDIEIEEKEEEEEEEEEQEATEEDTEESEESDEDQDAKAPDTSAGHKRKKSAANEEPNKAQKTSPSDGQTKPKASPSKVINFLLSDAVLEVCRPDDELQDIKTRGDIVTYSTLLSPFEELLCAVVLSRPISHRLGLRTIRTILNPPYNFKTPEAIQEAGSEKVHQALWDARTQHKDKTADQIELIADTILNNDWVNDLSKLREKANDRVAEEREILRSSIKGLGKTGLDIFYRRVQWKWEEAFPFIDDRTKASVEKLGLPGDVEELVKLVGEVEGGEEENKRRAFVLVLERAVGADLEKKIDRVLEEAGKGQGLDHVPLDGKKEDEDYGPIEAIEAEG